MSLTARRHGGTTRMTEIAAQLSILAAAQINGKPTNVSVELGKDATAGDVVRVVVEN